jgi:glycine hydroxymethyltransferase
LKAETTVSADCTATRAPAFLRVAVDQIARAETAARRAVNLVPSENKLSPLARTPLMTDLYHRYFFNDRLDESFWQFRGGQEAATLETDLARDNLRMLAKSSFVNVRPISGMSAMLITMSGLGGPPGRTVVSIAPETGGHYATTSVAARLGFVSRTVPVRHGVVNPRELSVVLRDEPALVYLDLQNSRHELAVAPIVEQVRSESPRSSVHVDCSHTLGLVLGGALDNPLDAGADSMGGSTHKTFPGPHKGVLFTRQASVHQRLVDAQFQLLSSHHFAETIALGLAAAEFRHFGPGYAARLVSNAHRLGADLLDQDFDVIHEEGHITSTHQVWVRVGDAAATDRFSATLYEAGIRVNVQVDLPDTPGPVLRLGLNEVAFDGATAESTRLLASAFVHARDGRTAALHEAVRQLPATYSSPFYYTDF